MRMDADAAAEMRVRARAIGARAGADARIDVSDACTLEEFRRVARAAVEGGSERVGGGDVSAVDSDSPRGAAFVSLNGREDLGRGELAREARALRELGVASGDLVWVRISDAETAEAETEAEAAETADARAMAAETRERGVGVMPVTMRETLEEWRGALDASETAFLGAHALMLDAGAKPLGDVALRDGLARRGCYSARYAIAGGGGREAVACTVRAQPVDGQLSMFASLETDGALGYAALVRASDYVGEDLKMSAENCRALWRKLRETMVTKLFEDAEAHFAGVLTPGTFASLPSDVKRNIAVKMDAYTLAYSSCTCRELRELCSDDELWTNLLREDFGIDRHDPRRGGISSRSLYNQHAMRRSAEREAQLRMESYHPMPGRLPRYGFDRDPERDIYPGLPGHVPGIIGGDYDLWPGGLNPNPMPRPIPGYGRGGLGGPGRPRGGWPGGGPPFPPQPGGLPYVPDPDADLRPGRGFPGPPNPGWDGRPRPPPDFF